MDASGNRAGEVRLWKVIESDGLVINEDFNYFEDITEFVNDFNTRANLIRRDILLSQMDERYLEKKDVVSDSLAEGFMQVEKLIKEQVVMKGIDFSEKKSIVNCYDATTISVSNQFRKIMKLLRRFGLS